MTDPIRPRETRFHYSQSLGVSVPASRQVGQADEGKGKGKGGDGLDATRPNTRGARHEERPTQRSPLETTLEIVGALQALEAAIGKSRGRSDPRAARELLAGMLLKQHPDLGMHLAVRDNPNVPKSLAVVHFPGQGNFGLKKLNDRAGHPLVDQWHLPQRNAAAVEVIEAFAAVHPEADFQVVSQGHKDIVFVISGVPEATSAAWMGELQPLIDASVRKAVASFLKQAAGFYARGPADQRGRVISLQTMLTQLEVATESLLQLGLHQIPEDATPLALRESWALASSIAATTRDPGPPQSGYVSADPRAPSRRATFSVQQFGQTLRRGYEVFQALKKMPEVMRGGVSEPLLLQEKGSTEWIHNPSLLEAARRGRLLAERPEDEEGIRLFLRSVSFTNALDFVYPGTRESLEEVVPGQLSRAGETIDALLGNKRVTRELVESVTGLLSEGPSGSSEPRSGHPSEYLFNRWALEKGDRTYIDFDLVGLGVHIQNVQTRVFQEFARAHVERGEQVSPRQLLDAMFRENDLVQRNAGHRQPSRAALQGAVEQAVEILYLNAIDTLDAQKDASLIAELKDELRERMPFLSGGDELRAALHPELTARPELRRLVASHLWGMKDKLKVRASISETRGPPGPWKTAEERHANAILTGAGGMAELKAVEQRIAGLKARAAELFASSASVAARNVLNALQALGDLHLVVDTAADPQRRGFVGYDFPKGVSVHFPAATLSRLLGDYEKEL